MFYRKYTTQIKNSIYVYCFHNNPLPLLPSTNIGHFFTTLSLVIGFQNARALSEPPIDNISYPWKCLSNPSIPDEIGARASENDCTQNYEKITAFCHFYDIYYSKLRIIKHHWWAHYKMLT